LYEVLDRLEDRLGGKLRLKDCAGVRGWPERGVYFFFEDGEGRRESGSGLRVVRVGTHAVTANSKSTLRQRLRQHRGTSRSEGGNHRGSIFRLLVGTAIKRRDSALEPSTWGVKGDPTKAASHLGLSRAGLVEAETPLEVEVSRYIGQMPLLFVAVDDAPSPMSARGVIEENAIALLSNYGRTAIDPPSERWLGKFCDRQRVRESGLWNNDYVDKSHDPGFLELLSAHASSTLPLQGA
jgi:hypothetical protein